MTQLPHLWTRRVAGERDVMAPRLQPLSPAPRGSLGGEAVPCMYSARHQRKRPLFMMLTTIELLAYCSLINGLNPYSTREPPASVQQDCMSLISVGSAATEGGAVLRPGVPCVFGRRFSPRRGSSGHDTRGSGERGRTVFPGVLCVRATPWPLREAAARTPQTQRESETDPCLAGVPQAVSLWCGICLVSAVDH